MEIKKVLLRKKDGIRYVLIPKNSEIREGTFVSIVPIGEKEVKEWQKKKLKKN